MFSFLSGFSSVCIKLGMLVFLFKMQVGKKHLLSFSCPVLHHQIIPRINSLIYGCFNIWAQSFFSTQSLTGLQRGQKIQVYLSYVFCRDFRTEVHKSYFCRVRSMVAGDLGSAGHLQVLLESD